MSTKDYGTPYTPSQRQVIESRGRDMLVSASAGTGKTTVMIERISELLESTADISEIVVVTFTNLAAAEMKNRLAAKLSAKRDNKRIIDQLERIDSANICTLHSFCGELLRNYFYVADIDPSYTILDTNLIAGLRQSAMDEVFSQYFDEPDEVFKQVYGIFAKNRKQANFYNVLNQLYDFSRCIADFDGWYKEKRNNLINLDEDGIVFTVLLNDIKKTVTYFRDAFNQLAEEAQAAGLPIAELVKQNAEAFAAVRLDSCEHALCDVYKLSIVNLGRKKTANRSELELEVENNVRDNFSKLAKNYQEKFAKKISNLCRGLDIQTLRSQTLQTVEQLDKLVEIVNRFDKVYYDMKKDRGGVDFNDLEHLTLKILNDEEAYQAIKSNCKYIFVDEYQDTNPVQEAIIARLATINNLFMVGDVKQSIYGFRGCEPNIFAEKEKRFERNGQGEVVRLNDNFRSNVDILDFVNLVFNGIMTEDFGKVDYQKDAQLNGTNKPVLVQTPSVRIDFVTPKPCGQEDGEEEEIGIYDITDDAQTTAVNKEASMVVKRVKQYVGMRYVDSKGNEQIIGYGDIVILLRTFKDKAVGIYNALISANVPVVANFNLDGYASKEIRDLINLMRVLDNPYNDVYLVGVCLSCFGNFTESELGLIRLNSSERKPFYDRLKEYAENGKDKAIADKVVKLLKLLEDLRFYSRGATVSETVLQALKLTQYHLYVQGLPNSGLRLRKMYNFIDTVKDASYAQSVDGFLTYLDNSEENALSDSVGATNAVRMMTMHASKGLEFPVVIIPDLEHQFRREDKTLACNFDLGVAMDYYDFNEMIYAPTLASYAYGICNSIKSNEEQMRLLYVAMTRAKYALNLVATATEKQLNGISVQPQRATSHLDWILYALQRNCKLSFGDDNENVFKNGKLEINVCDDVSDETEEVITENKLLNQETDERKILRKLEYKYPYAEQKDMPIKLVSSALDKAYIGVHEEYEPVFVQDDDRNYVGTAYHKVYQYADYDSDVEQVKQTIEELVANEQIERRFADKLDVNLICDTMRNSELRKLMSQGKIYHEMPFMLYCPYDKVAHDGKYSDDVMLQGVIDLLIIGNDKATVVDFKYTMHSDRVKDNYTAQLNSYKLAVQNICGIDNVDCYVLSIADNKLIKF